MTRGWFCTWSIEPSASTRALVQHRDLGARARGRTPCRARRRPPCARRRATRSSSAVRSVSCGRSCRRPARRPAAAAGPASAACRSRATASGRGDSAPASVAALRRRGRSSSRIASMRSRCAGVSRREQRRPERRVSPASASSRFSNTVRCSNTVGFWNLRPMPSLAISGSSSASQIDRAGRSTPCPASGRVLPVMTSIIVVLPAPFGPMMQRSSPGSTIERQAFERLEAVEADGEAVEVEDRAGASVGRSAAALHRLLLGGGRRRPAPAAAPTRSVAARSRAAAAGRRCRAAGTASPARTARRARRARPRAARR